MSDVKIHVQNEKDKDAKDSLPNQASPDTVFSAHAHKDQDKGVRGALPHRENKARRGNVNTAANNSHFPQRKYIVFYQYGRSDEVMDFSDDNDSRNAFVRKVMLILLVMLLITFAFNVVVMMTPFLKSLFKRLFIFIMIPCLIGILVMGYIMPLSACARRCPMNCLCLTVVVILYSPFCACFAARFETHIVAIALLVTWLVVFICVILAMTSFDFTKWLIYVIVIGFALMALSVIILVMALVFDIRFKPLMIGLSVLATLLQVVMLIIELQMVLGGKAIELGEEDYALGAYMLYTSIVQLFIDILVLIGRISED